MKQSKKSQDFFDRYLDEIYDVNKMLREEGKSYGECRYLKVVAVILLFIREDLRVLRTSLFGVMGLIVGLLLSSLFFGG